MFSQVSRARSYLLWLSLKYLVRTLHRNQQIDTCVFILTKRNNLLAKSKPCYRTRWSLSRVWSKRHVPQILGINLWDHQTPPKRVNKVFFKRLMESLRASIKSQVQSLPMKACAHRWVQILQLREFLKVFSLPLKWGLVKKQAFKLWNPSQYPQYRQIACPRLPSCLRKSNWASASRNFRSVLLKLWAEQNRWRAAKLPLSKLLWMTLRMKFCLMKTAVSRSPLMKASRSKLDSKRPRLLQPQLARRQQSSLITTQTARVTVWLTREYSPDSVDR